MALSRAPDVYYLGWHGRDNIGDDAIYDVVRAELAGAQVLDVPEIPRERVVARARQLQHFGRPGSLVIGGGTVVGRSNWRRLVDRGLSLSRNAAGCAVGIGVEDPAFTGFRSYSGDGELSLWPALLEQFEVVSVRGPRSAALLADVGFDVGVSGDPALLLPTPDISADDGLIGVNLGFGDDLWGHDPDQLVREVGQAVQRLSHSGHRFLGILMNPGDLRWTEAALADVAAEIVYPATAVEAADHLARCALAVVSRLHAGILAAVSATPVVSLEYQPKCRDFALSIDDERALIRTDRLTAGALVERVSAGLAERDSIRARTRSEVEKLRMRLTTDYGTVRRHIGLTDTCHRPARLEKDPTP